MSQLFEIDGLVATLSNAAGVDRALLLDMLDDLAAADEARVVVLEVSGAAANWSQHELRRLAFTPLPTVAALDGVVAGGALDLALGCDIRVGTNSTALRFSNFGAGREIQLLGRNVPAASTARDRSFSAPEALAAGLLTEIVSTDSVLARARELAAVVASRGPIATRLAKEAIWRGLEMPLAQALRFETDLTLLLQTTKDRAEGVAAFGEKRQPTFTGN